MTHTVVCAWYEI